MARKPRRTQQVRAGKQHHIDDYHEVVLDGAGKEGLADALMALNQQTHANRSRLLPEEAPALRLPQTKPGSRVDPQAEGTSAARELRKQMKEGGLRERTHYYSAIERAETGEIDRTYELGRPPRRKR